MGIRKYRGQIVCDKRWPDGTRTTRVCENRTKAKQLLSRINASIADGTWLQFKNTLQLRERGSLALQSFGEVYIEGYSRTRNKKRTCERKLSSLKSLYRFMGNTKLESITLGHLHNYALWRKSGGVSNATINRDVVTLKHLLS